MGKYMVLGCFGMFQYVLGVLVEFLSFFRLSIGCLFGRDDDDDDMQTLNIIRRGNSQKLPPISGKLGGNSRNNMLS